MSAIPRRTAATPARASFAQERMWFLEQLEGEQAAYNQLNTLLIKGPLDVGLLKKSLDEVVRRHEVLRTTLRFVDGELYQHVSGPQHMEVPFRDLSGLARDKALEEAERLSILGVKKRFDLAGGSMIEALLFRLTRDEYFLAFITHHAAFDGWSITILVDELSSIYEAIHHGAPLPPPPVVQYADYASWQRERFDRGEFREQLEYWKERLNGELPMLELPIDHARPAAQSFLGDVHERKILRPTIDALRDLARGERATLFMALLAAYGAFLFRHVGQEDIIIGYPVAGRTRLELERNIGLFVNTLPFRLRVRSDMTFIELLRDVRRAAFDAYERQEIPFEKLVENLQVGRHPSTTPVFQTLFQLRNLPGWRVSRDGIDWERHDIRYTTAKFDLTLETTETPSGLYCRFEYPPALFDGATIERMAGHWEIFLRGIASEPLCPIGRLPLLSDAEARRAVVEWNATGSPYPALTVHRIFEDRARKTPDAIAVVHDGETIAYGELNARANRLARYLAGRGIKPGTVVAVCMERSIDLVVCELGILKAGCAYTPIDPAYPPERIRFMADDVEAGLMLARQPLAIEGLDPSRIVCLREASGDLERQGSDDLPDLASPEATAYIIYTSGSTGRPKGVMVNHRGIVRLVINTNYVAIGPDDRVSFTSNPTFDVSAFDVWGALLNGARLVIFDRETLLSPREFAGKLATEGVTILTVTTQLFNLYSLEIPGAFRQFRDVFFAGEAADPHSVRRVLADGPPARLINIYGPTENTTYSTWYEIHDGTGDNVPIGKPISNSTAYVLDPYLKPLPPGVAGEIYVGGDGVAQGYHKRPDLTAAAFIPDPFADGKLIYRTGDIACYLPDGNIKFLGRRDGQVKIRGFRVEPGEVKAALETHPSVKEAYILPEDHVGGKRLIAYLTGRGKVNMDELRGHLRAKLPEYMVPSAFVAMEAFPLTPNGKVDHRAFPGPGHDSVAEAPADELEQALAGIWEELLGVSPIGIEDNFFDLGGHSLAAVRLLARIGERLKVRLPINAIFLAPTIRRMAAVIREEPAAPHSLILLRKGSIKPPLFCIIAIGGTLAEYRPMVEEFEEDREVYALQMPWHDPERVPASIEELAARLIEDIRSAQPHGPYDFLGYCAAGAVAYEMAGQLAAAGEEVGFLGFIDLVPPAYQYHLDIRSLKIFSGRVPLIVSNIAGAPPGQRLKKLSSVQGAAVQFIRNAFPARLSNGQAPGPTTGLYYPDWLMAMPGPYKEVSMAIFAAFKKYVFRPYRGNVVLLFSGETRDGFLDALTYSPTMGWEKYVDGKMRTYVIPGDHLTMTRPPNAKALARAVEECLSGGEKL